MFHVKVYFQIYCLKTEKVCFWIVITHIPINLAKSQFCLEPVSFIYLMVTSHCILFLFSIVK